MSQRGDGITLGCDSSPSIASYAGLALLAAKARALAATRPRAGVQFKAQQAEQFLFKEQPGFVIIHADWAAARA